MNNNLTLHNPYNPYQPLLNERTNSDPHAPRKYPSIPIPPTGNAHSPQSHGQMPRYPHLNPIAPPTNNQTQRIYPSFPVPPTGPKHNFAPQLHPNFPHPIHLIQNHEERKSNSTIENQKPINSNEVKDIDKKLDSGRLACYKVWLYILVVHCFKFIFLEGYLLTKQPPFFKLLAWFLLTMWLLIQSILAIQAVRKKSLEQAKKAVWFMKGFLVALLGFITYFIVRRLRSAHHHHHRGGHRSLHGGYGHGHGGHGYGHHGYGGYGYGHGYGAHGYGKHGDGGAWGAFSGRNETTFLNLCLMGLVVGLIIHILTLKGARKVRDLLAKREELMRNEVEEDQMRINV